MLLNDVVPPKNLVNGAVRKYQASDGGSRKTQAPEEMHGPRKILQQKSDGHDIEQIVSTICVGESLFVSLVLAPF